MAMNPEAKRALSTTIRTLRAQLIDDLRVATETAYRLTGNAAAAGLDEAARARRRRLEKWADEQRRAQPRAGAKGSRSAEDFYREAEKQAAYTLLNRLVLLRIMETPGAAGVPLRTPAVVTGGWDSRAYKDFRQLAPGLMHGDETEGYAFLLRLTFEDLATELPGVFGPAGVADLVPIPAATLRRVIDALNAEALHSCWTDDMTLGWVYQYWNDPEREAIDVKLNAGGKVEPHEIASKTQMFTERYMVDWLLQNSLGPMWIAMCRKYGWTPEVEADGTLDRLEQRRTQWRAKRAAGEVALTDLMPMQTESEHRWAYYLPQPIPDDAVTNAPTSLRDIKLLDPAVGSGHFLVVAFDLLLALYREEARHRGEAGEDRWSTRRSVESILSNNLHGIDLDPRAVQIAAAALWLKAKHASPEARPERLNLVASNLRLASLADDDPALVELRREVQRDTGVSGELTNTLIHALHGADHLGSLLKVEAAVDDALAQHEDVFGPAKAEQGDLFKGFQPQQERLPIRLDDAKAKLLKRFESFLTKHTGGDDLGLRLRGEQLAAGVRFVQMVKERTYDLVVANPPYQGTSKMANASYIENEYLFGKADLYAAFLLRGLQLVRDGGVSAMLTMRNWMFTKQYAKLREYLLGNFDIRALGDFAVGAFDEVPNDVLSVTVSVAHRSPHRLERSVAQQPTPPDDISYDRARTQRKRAATVCHEGVHTFDPAELKVVPEWPLVHWWSDKLLEQVSNTQLIGKVGALPIGLQTGNNDRFLRRPWEVRPGSVETNRDFRPCVDDSKPWKAYVKGAAGVRWFEPLSFVVSYARPNHAEFGTLSSARYGQGAAHYYREGVAYNTKGIEFSARAIRFASVFDVEGRSLFGVPRAEALTLLNSPIVRYVAASLNPTIHFTAGDVARIPFLEIGDSNAIFTRLEDAFGAHESRREPSVEFRRPGPSPWRYAQEWAQAAVDRPAGVPLPEYVEQLDPEPATDHLSFALGVALGRFGPSGEGVLDPATADLSDALPYGLLFLDTTLDAGDLRDGLGHPAAAQLHAAWAEHGPVIGTRRSLRGWLALDFFKDVHRGMYENRPIHWPLSSASRTFVAWVNIHRKNEQTLRVLLADHLAPTVARLDGELTDLRAARDGADKTASRAADRQYDRVLKARNELQAFIAAVEQCADRGAPPTDDKCPPRERDVRYALDLDDGVMINSAALWPLVDPQWKDPKKWWKELANATGNKDRDWAHLAMPYWPMRVNEKSENEPSLAVVHGCFWRYHPERAWAWELRLQDEIGPEFRIEEPPYRPGSRDLGDTGDATHRDAFLRDRPESALAAIRNEALRRMGRGKRRKQVSEVRILESGLWSAHAEAIWDMELDLSETQGAELRILAPDEPEARAAYTAEYPEAVRAREALLASLVSPLGFFELVAAEDDDEEGAEESEEVSL